MSEATVILSWLPRYYSGDKKQPLILPLKANKTLEYKEKYINFKFNIKTACVFYLKFSIKLKSSVYIMVSMDK